MIKKRMAYWGELTGRFPLRESYVALALWQQYHKRMRARKQGLEDQIRSHYPIDSAITAQESGPPYSTTGSTVVYRDLADVWKNSSEQLYALCKASGIDYYHFLHPNQYYKGTRTLTAWERENVVIGLSPYEKHAEAGFEHFQVAGQLLKASGVPYYDLSLAFADEAASVYRDSCCHYNERGTEIMAEKIAELFIP